MIYILITFEYHLTRDDRSTCEGYSTGENRSVFEIPVFWLYFKVRLVIKDVPAEITACSVR